MWWSDGMEGNYAFYIPQTHAQLTLRCVRLRNINVSGGAHIVLLRSDIHKNLSTWPSPNTFWVQWAKSQIFTKFSTWMIITSHTYSTEVSPFRPTYWQSLLVIVVVQTCMLGKTCCIYLQNKNRIIDKMLSSKPPPIMHFIFHHQCSSYMSDLVCHRRF